MKKKLTDAVVRSAALPGKAGDVIVWDTALAGYGLRVRTVSGGRLQKQFVVQYRDALRASRRFIIGSTDETTATAAREIAGKVLAGIRLGTYPHAERERQRKEAEHERDRAIETFGAITELYLKRQQQALRPRSFLEVQRHLQKAWLPLHRVSVHDINRRMIALRLTEIATQNGPVAANRARATLSGLFSWMVGEGIVEHNAVIGTNKPAEEKTRDRVLTDAELAAIWRACGDDPFGRIVKVLMLTGQRRSEVGGMRWDELDLAQGLWTMEGDRSKNAKKHVVPLTPEVVGILEQVPRRARHDGAEEPHVFGSGADGFNGWARAKIDLDARIEATGKPIAGWTLHDERRTMKTIMSDKLDVRAEVSEALLNHAKKGLEAIYNTAQYLRQKRAALELWTDYLRPIIDGTERKVVPMPARKEALA
jgi:integrase